MADVSLDELIRKRGLATGTGMYSRLSNRGGTGNVRSRLQTQISSRPIATSFQKTFDARQKIGVTDARLKLGVKDAREKLAAKDARFRIKGKVQDAREMLNSRKLQVSSVDKTPKVVDAREKLSLKRSTPAVDISPAIASGSSTIKLTKTIQIPQHKTLQSGLTHSIKGMRINVVNHQTLKPPEQEDEDEDDEEYVEEMELSHVPAKQMKITTQNSMLKQKKTTSSSSHFEWEAPWSVMQETRSGQQVHEKCAFTPQSGSQFSVAQAQALTKVVQNDTYTLPTNPQPITIPPPLRTKPMTNMSRTLVTKEDTPAAQAIQTEPVFSPLEGTKMTVTNLHPRVTEEDIVELFCVCGALKRARLISPGIAEVVFVRKDDAVGAYKKYNNRYLDGQPMKCNLHLNGSVITSDQPILLRLSDTPATTNKEGEARRANTTSSSVPKPAAEVDPDTILKALFKSSGSSAVVQPTAFKIKL